MLVTKRESVADMGFGKCFNIDSATLARAGGRRKAVTNDTQPQCSSALAALLPPPIVFCPGVADVQQCDRKDEGRQMCNDPEDPLARHPVCSRVPGAKALASYSCYNGGNVDGGSDTWYGGCSWSEQPCVFSPYYPPATLT